MSDTPRTDAGTHDDWSGGAEAVDIEVSKELERDLIAAKAKLAMAIELAERLGNTPGCPVNAFRRECNCGLTAAIQSLRE